MTRFARYTAPVLAVALLLGLTTLTQAQDPDPTNAGITLDGVSLGDHVLGPKLETDDLEGKVVVFEYWGDRCPPCIASIPSIVKLRGDYSTDKLAIVANQVWTENAAETKKAWEKRRRRSFRHRRQPWRPQGCRPGQLPLRLHPGPQRQQNLGGQPPPRSRRQRDEKSRQKSRRRSVRQRVNKDAPITATKKKPAL